MRRYRKIIAAIILALFVSACSRSGKLDLGHADPLVTAAVLPVVLLGALIVVPVSMMVKGGSEFTPNPGSGTGLKPVPSVAHPPSAELRALMTQVVLDVRSEIKPKAGDASPAHKTTEPASNTANDDQGLAKLNAALETALHDRLARAIPQKTASEVVDDAALSSSRAQSEPHDKTPIILIVHVDRFSIGRKDATSSGLLLKLVVSAEAYGEPAVGNLFATSWSLFTSAGAATASAGNGAVDLQKETDAALDTMVAAIVDDLFLSTKSRPVSFMEKNGEVSRDPTVENDPQKILSEYHLLRVKADCGDTESQLQLGKRLAYVESGIYRWRARKSWVEAYKWLTLRGNAENLRAVYAVSLLREKLTPAEIASAESLVADWRHRQATGQACSDAVAQIKRTGDAQAARILAAGTPGASAAGGAPVRVCEAHEYVELDQDRKAIEEAIEDYAFMNGIGSETSQPAREIRAFRALTLTKPRCGDFEVRAELFLPMATYGRERKQVQTHTFSMHKENHAFHVVSCKTC